MIFAFKRSTSTVALSVILASTTLLPVTAMAAPQTPFKVINTWKLGGDGSWDYLKVDGPAHLLYIARANRIMVVNIPDGTKRRAMEIASDTGPRPHSRTSRITL